MKHLFLVFRVQFVCIFATSFCLYGYQDPNLEQMIIDTNLEGVKVALSQSQLTNREKVGLICLADDMSLKRIKEREWWAMSSVQPFGSEIAGFFIAAFSPFGLFAIPCFFELAVRPSLTTRIVAVVGITAATCAVFTAGCLLARYGRKKLEQYVDNICDKLVKKQVDAAKIKKLINDAL